MRAVDARKTIIDSLVQRLCLLSRLAPVVLFLEDVQWSDPSTKDFIAAAIKQVETSKVLILITSRSEQPVGSCNVPYLRTIRLERLDKGSVADLVAHVDDERVLDESMRAQVVARANGVALFAQELTRMLVAKSARSGDTSIPATLHDSLMSQLDRLGPAAKSAAQLGATIGRTFPYWLLSALWPGNQQGLRDHLDGMVAARLITRRDLGSEEHYVFEHELVRDTAYNSLLQIQARAAASPDRAGDHRRAGARIRHAAGADRLSLHGRRPRPQSGSSVARGRPACVARIGQSGGPRQPQNGLACLRYLPEDLDRWRLELRLQTCLGQALIAISGHASPGVLKAFSRALELADRMEEVPELYTIVWGITAHHLVKGDIRRHLDLSYRLLQIAQTSNNSSRLVVAHTSRTLSLYFAGRFSDARRHLNQVLDRYDWERHRHLAQMFVVDRKTITMQFGTWTLWKLGYADRAAQLEEEMSSHARRLTHANSLAQALTAGASVYMLRREPDILLSRVAEGIAVAQAHGYPGLDRSRWFLDRMGDRRERISRGGYCASANCDGHLPQEWGRLVAAEVLRPAGRPAGRAG